MNWEVVTMVDSFTIINDNNNENENEIKTNKSEDSKKIETKHLLHTEINNPCKTKLNVIVNYFFKDPFQIMKINHLTKQIIIF